jgi:hypothetical protein
MYNNRLNEIIAPNAKSVGWRIRETNKTGLLEYGIWLTDDIFMGVPFDSQLKSKLSKIVAGDEFTYYLINDELKLKLIKTKTPKNKEIPMLTEAGPDEPATFFTAFATTANPDGAGKKIINVSIPTNNAVVVRDYIDKNRDILGIVVANTTEGLINPSITIDVTRGIIGSKSTDVTSYEFTTLGSNSRTETYSEVSPVETKFVSFNRFIPIVKAPRKSTTPTDEQTASVNSNKTKTKIHKRNNNNNRNNNNRSKN